MEHLSSLLVFTDQTFHYTHRITPKRVTSLRYPSPRYSNTSTWSDGKPFATLCKIRLVRDSSSRTPAHEARAL